MEKWIDLNNEFGQLYQISTEGRIRSKDFYDSWNRLRKGKILKHSLEKEYPRVRLSLNYKKESFRIHRLVAQAFIPNPNSLPQVNHIDGDKLNNHVDNLEWCNNSYNQKHAVENGLKIIKSGKESSRFNGEIFVYNKQNELVDILYGNKDMKEKGYDFRNVSAVVTGKRKTYKNLIFKKQ